MLDPQYPHIAAGAAGRRGRQGRDCGCAEGCRESGQATASNCGHPRRSRRWPRGRGCRRATASCGSTRASSTRGYQRGRPSGGCSSAGTDQPGAAAEGDGDGGNRRGHPDACAAPSEGGAPTRRPAADAQNLWSLCGAQDVTLNVR